MTGNEAIGEAAIQAGCLFYAGYPITPQNELTAYMAKRMLEEKKIFLQAESEIAAINMVLGAAASGVRAMTSSSSPGISLKQEGISYLAACQLPALIVNIMRGGPGLGNIAAAQSDYFQATKGGGHGDYHCIVLAPSTVQEAADFTFLGFDLADKYRNPVIILGDGMLGQMMESLKVKSIKPKRYKKPWALTGSKAREPNIIRSLFLAEGALEDLNLTLQKKYRTIEEREQRWQGYLLEDAKIVIVAYGTMARIARSVVKTLRAKGQNIGLVCPFSLWPFPKNVFKQLMGKKEPPSLLVIEMSYGQMLEDVKLVTQGKLQVDFLGRAGGGMPSEEEIIKKIEGLNG